MKKGLTEMVFILDKSGSMSGLESDTVGGFNSLIRKQQTEEGEAIVSTVLFSGHSEVLHDRVPIDKIEPMTERQYSVGGCTALLDATGDAIKHIELVHKYAREEDVPEHTVFVITTDGYENASRRYDAPKIKKMIESKRQKGWEFIFLGANIDALATAESYGIPCDMAADYNADAEGTAIAYEAVCARVSLSRANAPRNNRDWARNLDNSAKRSKKR